MKTFIQFFNLTKPLHLCESTLRSFFSPSEQSLPVGLSSQQKSQSLPGRVLHAIRGFLAGLRAISRTLEGNLRIYLGLWLMLVVAPISGVVYQFMPTAKDFTWFYHSWYTFFYMIGPELFLLFTLIGIFFLFPSNSRRAYFLAIPLGQTLAQLFTLVVAQSNNDIHATVPLRLVVEMTVCALPVLFLFNYLMDRQYHKLDGIKARIDGLGGLMKSELQKKLRDFQNQY